MFLYSFCIDFTFADNFMFTKFILFNNFESNILSASNQNWSLDHESRFEINS